MPTLEPPVVFPKLVEVYGYFIQSPRLTGVKFSYGQTQEAGENTPLRIAWIPTQDRYERQPLLRHPTRVVEGQRAETPSRIVRWAGVDLLLRVPRTGDPTLCALQLENLIEQTHLALLDLLRSDKNYNILDGRADDSQAQSDTVLGYVQPLEIRVELFDRYPTAPILTQRITEIAR